MSHAISSPCVGVCITDPVTGYCTGCLRTLEEIGSWLALSEDDRRAIIAILPQRLKNTHLTPKLN
jgi:predicted Fe-S protein YdhL (DUF1289 family)